MSHSSATYGRADEVAAAQQQEVMPPTATPSPGYATTRGDGAGKANEVHSHYRSRKRERSISPSLQQDDVDQDGRRRGQAVRRTGAQHEDVAAHRAAAEAVADHYNERPQSSIVGRQSSRIYQLRCFNNWVKAVLIQKFVRRGDRVLDIGIGKGGDLQKYRQADIGTLVGVDVAAKSIEQARDRYRTMNARYDASFHAADCYNDAIVPIVSHWVPFDIVTLQFCMHYAFKSERMVRIMLQNASSSLRRGGLMFGCIPDANVLMRRLRSLPPGETSFGNPIYRVKFTNRQIPCPLYGAEYTFGLEDAVDDCPEYLAHWPSFVKLAREYGLELVDYTRFHEFYERHIERYRDLFVRMKVVTPYAPTVDPDQWEAAGLYATFAFRKVDSCIPPTENGTTPAADDRHASSRPSESRPSVNRALG